MENQESLIKQLKASRGYAKASMTRLYSFVLNAEDVKLTDLSILQAKRSRLVELFKEYESYNKQILALDEKDPEDVAEIEDSYTSRAYQLERSDAADPTIEDFLLYLERRALALENVEPMMSGKTHHRAAVVNVAAASEFKSCKHYTAARSASASAPAAAGC
ncbi:uncharacterized protein isoform X2 [Choristoneura fumiferana]|uniref:uncharacterized protein isoform X2 n=1 Tax=Choristoneura fumiferana TaxID=7141 RepID=UPI003D154235